MHTMMRFLAKVPGRRRPDMNGAGYKYLEISEEIRSRIERGEYERRLPGQRALSAEFGVNARTVIRALRELEEEGTVERRVGAGTYVTRLRRSRTNRIGVVVGDVTGPLTAELVGGMQDAMARHGQRMILAKSHDDPEAEREAVEELCGGGHVDGLVMWPTAQGRRDPAADALVSMGTPFVLVPEPDPRVYADCHTVGAGEGARQVMRHLLAMGHRGIAFVGTDERLQDYVGVRYSIYREEMAALSEIDKNSRLVKGHVFLWKDGQTWEALWDLDGVITPA
jgi:DNA-binding LacI/PurR family transcriptional regulator